MKKIVVILLLLLVIQLLDKNEIPATDLRSPASAAEAKEFKYKYNFEGQPFSMDVPAKNWEEGLIIAAQACYQFYHASHQNEEHAMNTIDVCANPKK